MEVQENVTGAVFYGAVQRGLGAGRPHQDAHPLVRKAWGAGLCHLRPDTREAFDYIFSIIALPNSEHLSSLAPVIRRSKSYVTVLLAMVFSIPRIIPSATSCQPRCSNISTPDRITEPGLTLS